MLLSAQHPEFLRHLSTLGYGLQPIFFRREGRYALVIKASKEMILTARINGGFKVYLLDDPTLFASHLGFITAFFDDHDEPLVLKSPQFAGDDLLKDLTGLLSQPEFDVFFFDEHDRELMGVRVHNNDAARFRSEIGQATFASFDRAELPSIIERLDRRFSTRDAQDDARAFTLTLGERLYPDNCYFIDGREEFYRFRRAEDSIAATTLERDKAGPYQERDIAVMLSRVFDGESIYLNPIRADTGRELTDVLVVTDGIMMFVQAKDSPNNEASLRRTVDRKRTTIRGHVEKAAKQLGGAISYGKAAGDIVIRDGSGSVSVPVGNRQLLGMVVVREMFDDDYDACSAPVLEAIEEMRTPAVLLDYASLHVIAQAFRTPGRFLDALGDIFEMAMKNRRFPKPICLGPSRQE